MKIICQTFLTALTWWTTLMYFNTCDGGGIIILRPLLYDFTPPGVNQTPGASSYTMTLNGTDGESVWVGVSSEQLFFYAMRKYTFPLNISPVFYYATPFYKIKRTFTIHVRMEKHPANYATHSFRTTVDLVNIGKEKNITMKRIGRESFTLGYQMVCDPYSAGPLCQHCNPEVTHKRYVCQTGGVKVCKPGYINPKSDCNEIQNNCDPNPCSKGGKCINVPSRSHEPYKCQCPPQFQGKNCTDDVNECQRYSPCKNGGSCNNTHGSYSCRCTTAFQGKNCTDDVNECKRYSPCQNNGTCNNTHGSYSCRCKEGFIGEDCNKVKDICKMYMPCMNGGTCINVAPERHKCNCTSGFQGHNCDVDKNECVQGGFQICKNFGVCVNLRGGYECVCDDDHRGKNCDKKAFVCKNQAGRGTNPCQNGGKCVVTHSGNVCKCPPGYEGETCAEDIDECTKYPCLNNGTCRNVVGSFRCQCPPEFLGKQCEYSKGAGNCTNLKCKNGGTCDQIDGTSFCNCKNFYKGIDCSQKHDTCHYGIKFCENNGVCEKIGDKLTCRCEYSYKGEFCQYRMEQSEMFKETAQSFLTKPAIAGVVISGLVLLLILGIIIRRLFKSSSYGKSSETG